MSKGISIGKHSVDYSPESLISLIPPSQFRYSSFGNLFDLSVWDRNLLEVMNLETKASCEMVVEGADQKKDKLNVNLDKQEFTAAVHMQNNDAGWASEVGNNEMLIVSKDDFTEENFMGSEDAKDLEDLTDTITVNDCTNTAKEELLLPNKKVCKRKKVVKKMKLVKRKVTITKDEEKSQPSDMPDPSVEVRTNQDAKNEENLAGKTMNDSLLDKQEFAASVDMPDDEAELACEVGDDEIFEVCKDDIREGNFIGSENPKDLEALTDAITLNEDTNTSKEESLLPEKKVFKKRKLVKGKVIVAKDEEKSQSSDLPDPSAEVKRNQDVKKEKIPAGKTMNVSLLDKKELVGSADMQNDEAGLVSELGDDEIFLVPEDDIREESVMGSEDAKDLESLSGAITKNEKDKIRDDDTNTSKKMLVPEKKVIKRKKVVKKRILVKGKSAMAKDGEKPQTSDMPNMKDIPNMKEAKSESNIKLIKNTSHEVTAEDNDGGEPSNKHNSSNKVETMGMIFMCSSKTKEDCYRYKIMGLPASKKDAVLKIYKGMRLFLFDFELKLLYGIYKAAGPGGYNIEPNAFKSNFPSQVRFTAVRDCSPLPEEKFKNVIKDNYYTKNKFNSELNAEQVKSLCKLFQLVNKGLKSKAKVVTERPKVGVRSIVVRQNKKRVRIENDRGRERRAVADSGRDNKRRRVVDNEKNLGNLRGSRDKGNQRVKRNVVRSRAGNDTRRTRLEDDARRSWFEDDARRLRIEDEGRRLRADDDARRLRFEDDTRRLQLETEERRLRIEDDARRLRADDRRHSPLGLNNDSRYLRHADVYERETYLPSVLDALPQPALLPYVTSSYTGTGRTSLHGDYRLGMAIENEDRGLAYSRPTRHLYDYENSYIPPYREPIVYRDPGYDVSTGRSYYPSLASRDEHLPSTSRTSRYHLSPYRRY
ncbi:hypothetical protein V2J09_007442 [Rumex salicifolius]